jgi:hypothetical protein
MGLEEVITNCKNIFTITISYFMRTDRRKILVARPIILFHRNKVFISVQGQPQVKTQDPTQKTTKAKKIEACLKW